MTGDGHDAVQTAAVGPDGVVEYFVIAVNDRQPADSIRQVAQQFDGFLLKPADGCGQAKVAHGRQCVADAVLGNKLPFRLLCQGDAGTALFFGPQVFWVSVKTSVAMPRAASSPASSSSSVVAPPNPRPPETKATRMAGSLAMLPDDLPVYAIFVTGKE